jgi:hypothetical protein
MSLDGGYVTNEKGEIVLDKETGKAIWHGPARAEVEYWKRRALRAEYAQVVKGVSRDG